MITGRLVHVEFVLAASGGRAMGPLLLHKKLVGVELAEEALKHRPLLRPCTSTVACAFVQSS